MVTFWLHACRRRMLACAYATSDSGVLLTSLSRQHVGVPGSRQAESLVALLTQMLSLHVAALGATGWLVV